MIDDHQYPIAVQRHGQFPLTRRALLAASLATIAAAPVSKAFGGGLQPATAQSNPECAYAYAYVYVLG
ncbi:MULTISPECIES: hypothetical protein [unclassified Martelella]|uniref:hypothetical protein n=1 Tax=unclassified Martelella TaxID=2629616 RepID=UPI0025C56070|nr:hypothetical protein [Martelella sp.]|tara:strand:+ start:997 stop:1200 length:204 start_codon:yes stop_codon:yes gene_type:complete